MLENKNVKIIVGIESSCDETAVAIVDENRQVLSHKLVTQKEHLEYNGVVPEIAARAHVDIIDVLYKSAMSEAGLDISDVDAIAFVNGPGLIGGLVVGSTFAKGLSFMSGKPLVAVNHLQGHALMARFSDENLKFPFLLLLVSGGHTQVILVKDVCDYELVAESIDDACGECFDKVAKKMGLPYPGGPQIEKSALNGNADVFELPLPMIDKGLNFSFSGLKSGVLRIVEKELSENGSLSEQWVCDMAASFQKTVCKIFDVKLNRCIKQLKERGVNVNALVVSGGVGANQVLRSALSDIAKNNDIDFAAPPMKYCTDNGLMIAWAGMEMFKQGRTTDYMVEPNPRWQLEDLKK